MSSGSAGGGSEFAPDSQLKRVHDITRTYLIRAGEVAAFSSGEGVLKKQIGEALVRDLVPQAARDLELGGDLGLTFTPGVAPIGDESLELISPPSTQYEIPKPGSSHLDREHLIIGVWPSSKGTVVTSGRIQELKPEFVIEPPQPFDYNGVLNAVAETMSGIDRITRTEANALEEIITVVNERRP